MLTKEIGVKCIDGFSEDENRWVRLLCRYGDIIEFTTILDSSVSTLMAIMRYRRVLNNRGKNTVSFNEIEQAYICNNCKKLHILFEQMYLEPISKPQFNFIMTKINGNYKNIEKLYQEHLINRNERVLKAILKI